MSDGDGEGSSVEDDELDVLEEMIHDQLSEITLKIKWYQNENDGYDGVFANVDSFLELSKGNNIVQVVDLDPNWYNPLIRRSDVDWEEKLGRALGNLQSLKVLTIQNSYYTDDNDEEPPYWDSAAWEPVARVLRHVWQKITLNVLIWDRTRGSKEAEAFARAIRGHPTIQRFQFGKSNLKSTAMRSARPRERVAFQLLEAQAGSENRREDWGFIRSRVAETRTGHGRYSTLTSLQQQQQ
jgi:hypothetical protein